MKIHTTAACYAIAAGVVCGLNPTEWTAILICVALVLGGELINTAIEITLDELHPGYSRKIGTVKDMAAGAVFVFAAISVICGLLIFLPGGRPMRVLLFLQAYPLTIIPLAAGILWTIYTYIKTPSEKH